MAKAPLSQTVFLTEDGSSLNLAAVDIPALVSPPTNPAPSFTARPSIEGSPVVGQELTGNDGTILNGTVVSRRWVLGGVAVSTTQLYTAAAAGTLAYEVTAAGLGGTTVGISDAVTVTKGDSSLARLALSQPVTMGSPIPANTTLLNRQAGSTFTTNYPGLTIDNATGAVSGTPAAYSGLITEHSSDGRSRDTVLFGLPSKTHTMHLAMNMAPLNYYTFNDVYIDLMKSAGVATAPATVDERNMPLTLAPWPYGGNRAVYLLPFGASADNPIAYRIITDGDMDFEGFTKNGADYVATVTLPLGGQLHITAIRTPPTRLALVREDEAALFKAGQTLKPDFLEKMAGMAHIRTMDWNGTNEATSNTTPDNNLFYDRVPFQAQIRLSRELGSPLWYPLHASITDAQFQEMFSTLDQQVADGLIPKIEYSNEVWNGSFVQNKYATDQAAAAGYSGEYPAAWWAGRRTAQLAKLARGRGYRIMGGVQPAVQAQAPAFLAGFGSVAGSLRSDMYGWTTTGYNAGTLNVYGPDPDGRDTGQGPIQDRWVRELNYDAGIDNIENSTLFGSSSGKVNAGYLREAKAIASANGWSLEEYESNWLHGNVYAFSRYPHADYNGYLFTIVANPLAYLASMQNMQVSEDEGVAVKTWFNYNDNVGNSDGGRFGVRRVPAMAAITRWLADGGAVPRVVIPTTLPPAQSVGARYWRITPTQLFGDTPTTGSRFGSSECTFFDATGGISKSGWTVINGGANAGGNVVDRLIDGSTTNSYITESAGTPASLAWTIDTKTGMQPTLMRVYNCSEAFPFSAQQFIIEKSADGLTWTTVVDQQQAGVKSSAYVPAPDTPGSYTTVSLT